MKMTDREAPLICFHKQPRWLPLNVWWNPLSCLYFFPLKEELTTSLEAFVDKKDEFLSYLRHDDVLLLWLVVSLSNRYPQERQQWNRKSERKKEVESTGRKRSSYQQRNVNRTKARLRFWVVVLSHLSPNKTSRPTTGWASAEARSWTVTALTSYQHWPPASEQTARIWTQTK